MRSSKTIPVGKGCKKWGSGKDAVSIFMNGRCQCHVDQYLNNCFGCGKTFHTSRPQTKTCSNACRMRLSRMRHEKMFQMIMALTA